MCSFASCRKGKHMCARSVVNKLLCGIHQWPDVMDKRQTNALTPLLDQLRRKGVTEQESVWSVTVGGKSTSISESFGGVREHVHAHRGPPAQMLPPAEGDK